MKSVCVYHKNNLVTTYRYFIRIKKRNLLGIALRPTVKLGLKDRTVEMEIVKITDNGAKRTHTDIFDFNTCLITL